MLESASGAGPRVALLARAGKASDNLADALRQAGAALVLTADPITLDEDELLHADVRAVLVALEPGVEQALDRFDSLLSDPAITVIFDEAEIAAHRAGWDAARWVRHLSAKLNRHDDVLPPGTEADQNWHPSPGQLPKPASAFSHLDLAPFAQEALARADSVPVDGIQIETATRIVVATGNEVTPFEVARLEAQPAVAPQRVTSPPEAVSLRTDVVEAPSAGLRLADPDDVAAAPHIAHRVPPLEPATPNLALIEEDAVPAVSTQPTDVRDDAAISARFEDAISNLTLADIDSDPKTNVGDIVIPPEQVSHFSSHAPPVSARQSPAIEVAGDVTSDNPFAGLSLEAMTPGPASAQSRRAGRLSLDDERLDDVRFDDISFDDMPSDAAALDIEPLDDVRFESVIVDSIELDSMSLEGMSLESMPLESMPLESMPLESMPLESMPLESMPLESMPLESMPADIAVANTNGQHAAQTDEIALSAFDLGDVELELTTDPTASGPAVGMPLPDIRQADVFAKPSLSSDPPLQNAGAAFILSDAASEPEFVSYSVIDVGALQIEEHALPVKPELSPLQFDDDAFFLQELSAGNAARAPEFSIVSEMDSDVASGVRSSLSAEPPAMFDARPQDEFFGGDAGLGALPKGLRAETADAVSRPDPDRIGERADARASDRSNHHASTLPPVAHGFSRDLSDLEQRIAGLSLVDFDASPGQTSQVASAPAGVESIVLVEAGLGGPDPVRQLLAAMPGTFSPHVLVRLHLQGGRYDRLVAQMARAAALPVALAESGEGAMPGTVYFLPEGMNIIANEAGLIFVADAAAPDAVYAALAAAQSAIVFLSGSDPALVEAAMSAAGGGALVLAQSPDDCYDGIACAELRTRGVPSGLPAELAGRLSARWPSRS